MGCFDLSYLKSPFYYAHEFKNLISFISTRIMSNDFCLPIFDPGIHYTLLNVSDNIRHSSRFQSEQPEQETDNHGHLDALPTLTEIVHRF